jgi:hypothetical protein
MHSKEQEEYSPRRSGFSRNKDQEPYEKWSRRVRARETEEKAFRRLNDVIR